MAHIRAWFKRLTGQFGRRHGNFDLAEELNGHLDAHIADNIRAGMDGDQARRHALLKLGGIEIAKEACRDRRGLPLLDLAMQDLRYALRTMRRNAGSRLLPL
jgi:hypothetical protein